MTEKLCPKRPFQTGTTIKKTEFSECIESRCAWYDSDVGGCAVARIGKSM